jgi:hypothetical protein
MKRLLPALVLFVALAGIVMAQRRYGYGSEGIRTAREVPTGSTGTPTWDYPKGFGKDVFTFTRIRYGSRGGRWGWTTDLPDSDLNLSYRLQQMTSTKVDPDGRIVNIMDPDLHEHPWTYMAEPGNLSFTEAEVPVFRKYLLNGGFVMLDDFWGDSAWRNVEREFKRVFPEYSFVELPLDHPLYTCVFSIKTKGQVPNVRTGDQSQYTGVTWENNHDGDTRTVHHRAIFDEKGRLLVLATHNTDNGDGWEREGESAYFFANFSEKIAYPLGINIIFYVMTH